MCVFMVVMLQILWIGTATMVIFDPCVTAICIDFFFPDRETVLNVIDDVTRR